jgi:hypothetical protein
VLVKREKAKDPLKDLDKKSLKVGWFKAAKYEDGTQVAAVALIQELGDAKKHIPPRPFIQPTIIREKKNWQLILQQELKRVLKKEITINNALDVLGLKAAGNIRATIRNVWSPPLAQRTIDERLRRYKKKEITENLKKPLIDTKLMINSVNHEISDE